MKTFSKIASRLCVVLPALLAGPASAGSECWLDIYDKTDFQGARVRIQGPADLPKLHLLQGADWSRRIESLVVGNSARVTVFRQEEFREDSQGPTYHGEAIAAWGEKPGSYSDQELSFGPGKKEHHLGELNFHRSIASLIVRCID